MNDAADTTDQFKDWDAAYVLGALSPDERRAYERHVATCPSCAADLADLAGLPGILSKVSTDEAVALLTNAEATERAEDAHLRGQQHVPGLVQRLAIAATRRRRRLRVTLGASAALVVALLVGGGIAFAANVPPAVNTVAMTQVQPGILTAQLAIEKKGWGTRLDWSCEYPDATWDDGGPHSYDLVVTTRQGVSTTVGSWTTAGPRARGLTASTSIPTSDIRSVEIRPTGSTTVLLRSTP